MANVLAILTPGNSRSQTTNPLTQSTTGSPGTVAGPYADSAWNLNGSTQVRFTAVSGEIGADHASGSLAFWFKRPAANGTGPDLVVLGDGGTPGAFIYPYYINSSGDFWVEFYDGSGNYLTDLTVHKPVASSATAFVYIEWNGANVRMSVDAGTFVTGNRGSVTSGGFGGNLIYLALPSGTSRAAILGPAVVNDGPLTNQQVTDLFGRTVAWSLDMGTAGWANPPTVLDVTTVPVTLPATGVTIESGAAIAATATAPTLPATSATIAAGTTIAASPVAPTLPASAATITSGATIAAAPVAPSLPATAATITTGATIAASAAPLVLPATGATITSGATVEATPTAPALPATSADIVAGATIAATATAPSLPGTAASIEAGVTILVSPVIPALPATVAAIASGAVIVMTTVAVALPVTIAEIIVAIPIPARVISGRLVIAPAFSARGRSAPALAAEVDVVPAMSGRVRIEP